MTTIVGTPFYVAPEVLRGEYDKSCDIWSLGIILYIFLSGYPPFDGDNNLEIFKNVMQQEISFKGEHWENISAEACDLISKMLEKDPKKRISASQCEDHPWFRMQKFSAPQQLDHNLVKKLRDFRAPKMIQQQTLMFMVNNLNNPDLDFKAMRQAFRTIDTQNSGIITLEQLRKEFVHHNYITCIDFAQIENLFNKLDFNKQGRINYSEFMAGLVDKQVVLKKANLQFAFDNFDIDGKGYITKSDLIEVFRRQGQVLSDDQLAQIIKQVKEQDDEEEAGKVEEQRCESPRMKSLLNVNEVISWEEFSQMMRQIYS